MHSAWLSTALSNHDEYVILSTCWRQQYIPIGLALCGRQWDLLACRSAGCFDELYRVLYLGFSELGPENHATVLYMSPKASKQESRQDTHTISFLGMSGTNLKDRRLALGCTLWTIAHGAEIRIVLGISLERGCGWRYDMSFRLVITTKLGCRWYSSWGIS